MFSTSMSLEDRLRLKQKVKYILMYGYNAGPPIGNPYMHSTTVLCDIQPAELRMYRLVFVEHQNRLMMYVGTKTAK